MNIAKILAPVDFSVCSAVAIAYASELSRLLGASVQALHVTSPTRKTERDGETPDNGRGADRGASKELEQLVAAYQQEGYAIGCKVRVGRPADEIIAEADEGDYDLIVMGTHGRNRLVRLLRQSTLAMVLRRARCPVVAVRNCVVPGVEELAERLSSPDLAQEPTPRRNCRA